VEAVASSQRKNSGFRSERKTVHLPRKNRGQERERHLEGRKAGLLLLEGEKNTGSTNTNQGGKRRGEDQSDVPQGEGAYYPVSQKMRTVEEGASIS